MKVTEHQDEGKGYLKKIISVIGMILFVLQTALYPVYGETKEEENQNSQKAKLKLYSQSAALIDGDSGRVLYGKEELIRRPMASTTKIMTCIIALEYGNLDDIVTASSYAASQPKVHLGVREGEQYYLRDLLYALMLESYNDAAVIIAEHVGGSTEGFAELMNQKARDLGCYDTYFITPNGLDAVKDLPDKTQAIHSTTAVDLSRIMKYCVTESEKKEEFMEITRTQNYSFSEVNGKRSYSCNNHNSFLTMMPGVLSGKTGFTGGAGYSYVAALEDDGRTFVIALLGCGWPPHKTYKWSDARLLMNYGKENYHYRQVFQPKNLDSVPVYGGIAASNDLSEDSYTELTMNLEPKEQELNLLMRDDEKVSVRYEMPKALDAPVKAGTVVGTVSYSLNGQLVKQYPVYTCTDVEKLDLKWCIKKVMETYLCIQP